MAKRTVYAPRQFDSETWIVVRYDDTRKLSELFRASQIETADGEKTGMDCTFVIGDKCLAPWKRAGTFPALVAVIDDDKTMCLKKKQAIEKTDKIGVKRPKTSKVVKSSHVKSSHVTAAADVTKKRNEQLIQCVMEAESVLSPLTANAAQASMQPSYIPLSESACATQPQHALLSKPASSSLNTSQTVPAHLPAPISQSEVVAPPISQHVPSTQPTSGFTTGPISQHVPLTQPTSLFTTCPISQHVPSTQPTSVFTTGPISQHVPSTQPTSVFTTGPISQHVPLTQPTSVFTAGPISQHVPLTQPTSVFTTCPISQPVPSTQPTSVFTTCPTSQHAPSTDSAVPIPQHEPSSFIQLSSTTFQQPAADSNILQSLPDTQFASSSPSTCSSFQFHRFLSEECSNCIILDNRVNNLQQEVELLKRDSHHIKRKYEVALKELEESKAAAGRNTDSVQPLGLQSYTPNKGLKIPKAEHIVEKGLTSSSTKPGYVQFGGEGSNVQVPVKWLGIMSSKTKMAPPSLSIKKYMDGFFNPWEIQGLSASTVSHLVGDKKEVFDALELFACRELGMSSAEFSKAVNTKAGACRQTVQNVYPESAMPKRPKGIPSKKK